MNFGLHAGGFGRRSRFDPYYPWVTALVPMEGTNGSTSFPDIKAGLTFTAGGSVAVSNAQSRTGQGTSTSFAGGTSDLISATVPAFGTTAYAVEMSMRPTSNNNGGFGSLAPSVGVVVGPSFWIVGGSGANRLRIGQSTAGQFDDLLNAGTIPNSTWTDIKHGRSNGTAFLFFNNVSQGTTASTRNLNSTLFRIGTPYGEVDTSSMFTGYGSWLRITKGFDRAQNIDYPPFARNA